MERGAGQDSCNVASRGSLVQGEGEAAARADPESLERLLTESTQEQMGS